MGCIESRPSEKGGTQMNPMATPNKLQFNEKYRLGAKLGEGAFAIVKV